MDTGQPQADLPQKVPLPYKSVMTAGPSHCYWGKLGSHDRKMITACWTEIIPQQGPYGETTESRT